MKISSAFKFKTATPGDDGAVKSQRVSELLTGFDLESAHTELREGVTAKTLGLSEAQINAAMCVKSLFTGNTEFDMESYEHLSASTDAISGFRRHGAQGFTGRLDTYSLESYSGDTKSKFVDYSVDFNAGAARQDEFGEGFFRTIVVANNIDAVNMEITLPVVYDRHTHAVGKDFGYYQRTVIHALIDPTILKSSVTKLIPAVSSESASFFVASALSAPTVVTADGQDITTNYLKAATEINLLATTNRPNSVGKHDTTDTIDGAALDRALYKFGSTNNALVHNVSKAPSAAFLRRENGKENDMILSSSALTLVLDKDTLLNDGTKLSAQTAWAALETSVGSVRISYQFSGTLNSQTSITTVNTTTIAPKIQRITDVNGDQIALTDASVADIVGAIATLTFAGFKLAANVDNKNRRQAGKLIDAHTFKDRYQILFGQPLTSMRSTFQKDSEEAHKGVQALVDIQRATNSNNAVASLFDYREALQVFGAEDASVNFQALDELPGLARRVMKPWSTEKTADVLEHVQSLRSSDIRADISAFLINQLAAQVFAAYNNSWYSAALSHYSNNNGGTQERPRVIIGTTPEIAAYLNQIGDARLLGDLFETKVVVSPNADLEGLIMWTFGQTATGDAAPLESGWFFWSPELMGDINISSNAQTSSEVVCIPRAVHVKNTPVLGTIVVENLAAAVTTRIEFKVTTCCDEEEVVTPPEEEPENP